MKKITAINARMILDSRGNPTVEARVSTPDGSGVAAVPSGASTGSHEALELRDGDRRWNGQGVSKAVSHVNVELSTTLLGRDATDQAGIDQAMIELDGTPTKSRLGANAILAASLATARAAADSLRQPVWQYCGSLVDQPDPVLLPVPLCNVINGGAHADNALRIQEFMLVPHGFDTFSEALRAATETYHALGKLLHGRAFGTAVGDEGGYAPNLDSHQVALDLLLESISQAGYRPAEQISIALDVAASELQQDAHYQLDKQALTMEQLVAEYASLIERYPIVSIEDPFGEDDWAGWERGYGRLGEHIQIVGDDLTVSSPARVAEAIERGVINAAILKPNQIGTLTELRQAFTTLTEHKLSGIISHRSGETSDATIADIAVGWQAGQLKAGAPARGERVAKYNQVLAIEQQLGGRAVYGGAAFAKQWSKRG